MIDTYDDLLRAIAEYLGRSDLSALIPQFVRLAEARMNRELRLKLMEREAWTRLPAGRQVIALPDKRVAGNWDVFLEMRDLRVNGNRLQNLDFIPIDAIPEQRNTGAPKAYAIRGRELVLIPVPDGECELLLTYYAEVPPLGDKQPSNDILIRSPDLYLYGALVASVPYARGSVPLELWESFYNKAADSQDKSDNHGRFTANLTMRPIRSV